MRKNKQIAVNNNIYFALLQLKVDYKLSNWNELFAKLLEDLKVEKEGIEEDIKNGKIIKKH